MKKILSIVCILLTIISCGSGDTERTMTVNGNIKGLKKGTLYFQSVQDSILATLDSIQIKGDGKFSFKTELESPEIFYLYLDKKDNNDINDRITFFGEPGTITINTNWNSIDTDVKIEGSETQKKLEEYKKNMTRFNLRNLDVIQAATNPEIQLDSFAIDSLQRLNDRNIKLGYAYALNFALNNTDSYIAPYIALNEVSDANIKYLDSINNKLTPEVSGSKYGKALNNYLKKLKNLEK